MKKFILLLLVGLFVAAPVMAEQFWRPTDQITVAAEDSNTYAEVTTHEYVWYTKGLDGVEVEAGVSQAGSFLFTLTEGNAYLIGCKIVLKDAASGEVLSESVIAWSDNPEYVSAGTFGVAMFTVAPVKLISP